MAPPGPFPSSVGLWLWAHLVPRCAASIHTLPGPSFCSCNMPGWFPPWGFCSHCSSRLDTLSSTQLSLLIYLSVQKSHAQRGPPWWLGSKVSPQAPITTGVSRPHFWALSSTPSPWLSPLHPFSQLTRVPSHLLSPSCWLSVILILHIHLWMGPHGWWDITF